MAITEKVCHACKAIKPVSNFYRSSSSKDGYAPSCKDCQNGRTTTPDTTPKTMPQKITKKPKVTTKPESRPSNEGLIPSQEPDEIIQTDDHLRARDWIWWKNPDRVDALGRPCPYGVAGWIISINYKTGTAIIETFKDHPIKSDPSDRTPIQTLVPITSIRRRIRYY